MRPPFASTFGEATADPLPSDAGTNHVGHALLFKMLQPTLSKAPDARLVVLSSEAYMIARGVGLDTEAFKEDAEGRMGVGLSNYGRSKVRSTGEHRPVLEVDRRELSRPVREHGVGSSHRTSAPRDRRRGSSPRCEALPLPFRTSCRS